MKHFFSFLKSKVFLIQLGLALLVTLVLCFVVLQWLKSTTNHGDFIEVPDLAKMTVPEMRDALEEAKLQYMIKDSTNYNPDYPRFSILEQTPKAGTKVKENRKIYVTVNPSGYKEVSVPKVIQITQRNAAARLRAVGLDVQRVTYIDQIGKDMVYYVKYKGKRIAEGAKLPKTSKVELVCGNGKIPDQARVQSDSE